MLLTKEQILAADDLPTKEVPVPEWGGSVFVRTMTGIERDAMEAEAIVMRGESVEMNRENTRGRLLARAICDAGGNRLFTDADAPALGKKSGAALSRLYDVASKLNRLTAADVDELSKNSDAGQSAGNGSN